jgi:FkbM family methyltransferase
VKTQELPQNIQFSGIGIASFDGVSTFYPPKNPNHVSHSLQKHRGVQSKGVEAEFRRVSTIMKQLNHDCVDLMKMDIEGAEYDVIADIAKSDLCINQLCVEFHHRFSGFNIRQTREAVRNLARIGLRLFHQGDCVCSFIKK